MGKVKQIGIKNRTFYLYNKKLLKMTNLLKQKIVQSINIYYIGYITIKEIDDCENIYSVNHLYLIIGKVHGQIEENNESKSLAFDSTDEKRELGCGILCELTGGFVLSIDEEEV